MVKIVGHTGNQSARRKTLNSNQLYSAKKLAVSYLVCDREVGQKHAYILYHRIFSPSVSLIYIYVEKVKRKKNMFDGLFICQRVSTSIFFEYQSVLLKLF